MKHITNIHEFKRQVVFGETKESATLEFKRDFEPGDNKNRQAKNLEIARQVAALANTLGGTIVVGVDEDGNSVASEFAKNGPGRNLKDRVADVIHELVYPHISASVFEFNVDGHHVVTICVDPIEDGVAYAGKVKSWSFPRREDNGIKDMHPSEIDSRRSRNRRIFLSLNRLQILDRSNKINLESLAFERFDQNAFTGAEKHAGLRRPTVLEIWVKAIDEHQMNVSFNDRDVSIPMAYVDEVWLASSRCISLSLRCVVILPKDFSNDPIQIVPPGVDYNL